MDLLGPRVTRSDGAYELHMRQVVPVDRQVVWRFFENIDHLERLVPERFHLEVLEASGDRVVEGAEVEHRQRVRGIPFTWTTRIAEVDPGRRFVDVQEGGPFATWRHEHSFRDVQGGTAIVDHVTYRLPLEPVSRLAHALVAWDLRRLFRERAAAVARELCPGDRGDTEGS